MGAIAKKYCENIYLTDDNPTIRKSKIIRDQIKKGLKYKKFLKFHQDQKLYFMLLIN